MSLKKCHVQARRAAAMLLSFSLCFLTLVLPVSASQALTDEQVQRLEAGEIILDGSVEGRQRGLVEGKILIKSKPDRVWSIVINPGEFANKIQKHLKEFRFLKHTPLTSILDCHVEVASFLPKINYIVESFYHPCRRIDFRRVGGSLRDFHGYWLLEPRNNGTTTLVTYAMYIDPGFFVPQWIMRAGLRRELPQTLDGIRARVEELEIKVQAEMTAEHS